MLTIKRYVLAVSGVWTVDLRQFSIFNFSLHSVKNTSQFQKALLICQKDGRDGIRTRDLKKGELLDSSVLDLSTTRPEKVPSLDTLFMW